MSTSIINLATVEQIFPVV